MESEKLTAAVLGLDDNGLRLLRAAAASGCFQIRAVADLDAQRAEKTAAEFDCQAYGDYRQLIVQNQFDCLLVAAETHTCAEQLKTALRRKFNILKLAPPARTFEEAREYMQLAENEKVRFVVADPTRFKSSYTTAHELISQGRIEHVSLIRAYCSVGDVDRPVWQIDPKLAGGGVLLHECYGIVDQILWNFPIPAQVYALKTSQAPDKKQRLYVTEDTAVVSMRFSDALIGNLVVTRHGEAAPNRVSIEIHGKEARLRVTDTRVELTTREGQDDRTWQYEDDEQMVDGRLLANFAESLLDPGDNEFAGRAGENLRNMALLESAYLSAKTGFPEEPARILQRASNRTGAGTSV